MKKINNCTDCGGFCMSGTFCIFCKSLSGKNK